MPRARDVVLRTSAPPHLSSYDGSTRYGEELHGPIAALALDE